MESIKHVIDKLSSPQILFLGSVAILTLFLLKLKQATSRKAVVGSFLALAAFYAFALMDKNFRSIVAVPDNVPITLLLVLVMSFTFLGFRKAAVNDERIGKGLGPLEKEETDQRIFVWPDLVYVEFICLILLTVVLVAWAIGLQAPLEPPANPSKSPNPSKAPWYFLGLQEMLVYYDPWIAGVLLPAMIILGLMALPYIDPNPKGNGYYTFKERPFAISMFLGGFLVLWVSLIILGTFLRGPNWNFFGPFEQWRVEKVEPLLNVNLSEYIWVKGLGVGLPKSILVREGFGILGVLFYFGALPPLLAFTVFKKLHRQMGFIRYNVMAFLFLMMMALPIKMLLRWTLNLKYIVYIPEYFFNI
jgi:cytochrome b/b6/petD-like protein